MKHPPPIPELSLSTTPRVSATATVASMALPPSLRTFRPACVAIGLTEATIPLLQTWARTIPGERQTAKTARHHAENGQGLFGCIVFFNISGGCPLVEAGQRRCQFQ